MILVTILLLLREKRGTSDELRFQNKKKKDTANT